MHTQDTNASRQADGTPPVQSPAGKDKSAAFSMFRKYASAPWIAARWVSVSFWLLVYILAVVFTGYLFKQQLFHPHHYVSDLPIHVYLAQVHASYSLIEPFFNGALWLFHGPMAAAITSRVPFLGTLWLFQRPFAVVVCLTAAVLATSLCTAYFVRSFSHRPVSWGHCLLIGLLGLFVSSIYLPGASPFIYTLETYTTQPWHNSTFILMRATAFAFFAFSWETIIHPCRRRLGFRQLATFALLLALVNYAKPNFIIAFGPAYALWVCIDVFRGDFRERMPRALCLGACMAVTSLIMVYQYLVLFPKSDGGGVALSMVPLKTLIGNRQWYVLLLCGLAFPIFVTVWARVRKMPLGSLLFAWLCYLLSLVERLTFFELGSRATHGNFTWGERLFAAILFVCCMSVFVGGRKNKSDIPWVVAGWLLLLAHVFSGIYYFASLSRGAFFIL